MVDFKDSDFVSHYLFILSFLWVKISITLSLIILSHTQSAQLLLELTEFPIFSPQLKISAIVIHFIIRIRENMPAAQMVSPVNEHIGPCVQGICSSDCQHR